MASKRPDSCPECGESCTSHTGSYCHACGTLLIPLRDTVERAREAFELFDNRPGKQMKIGDLHAD